MPQIVAKKLIGKEIVCKTNCELIIYCIVEIESYGDCENKEFHAFMTK
jgi:3-methyladenine DNA glycosylase Mpg